MSKLLLIGAGCSKNYSESTSAIPDLTCPLDGNFFKMAKKVILHGQIDDIDLLRMTQDLIRSLHRIYGYKQFDIPTKLTDERFLEVLDDERLSLEKVMTELSLETGIFLKGAPFYGYAQKSNPAEWANPLGPLIELVAVTISKALEGPACPKHKRLAESLKKGDVIVSFNYDILMDNALRYSGKLTDSGYLLPFHKVSDDQEWVASDLAISEVALIKLHGSLNWMRCSYCGSYFLMRSGKIEPWYVSLPKDCPNCRTTSMYLERVIIPPLLTKDYSAQPMDYLWREASRRVSSTNEMVIIGYSFPPTDFATEMLLRIGHGWDTQKAIKFTIVNPDKQVFERFHQMFSTSKVRWLGSLEEYLSTL